MLVAASAGNSPLLPPNNGSNAGRGYQTLGGGKILVFPSAWYMT